MFTKTNKCMKNTSASYEKYIGKLSSNVKKCVCMVTLKCVNEACVWVFVCSVSRSSACLLVLNSLCFYIKLNANGPPGCGSS